MSAVSMPTPTSHRPICLGFESALQLHRAASFRNVALRASRNRLPEKPPLRGDVTGALDEIQRLGLLPWFTVPIHTLSSSRTLCRATAECRPHAVSTDLPPSCFTMIGSLMCAKVPLAFVQVATRLSLVDLIELGYELCGTYRATEQPNGIAFDVAPLTSKQRIRAFLDRFPGMNGSAKAREALRYMADGSASPRETKIAMLLALPHRLGGFGLAVPSMNHGVRATAKARAIAGRGSFRCDLCWPDAKIDLEYQSREFHEGEKSRIRDSRRTNALESMGFKVVSVTNEEFESLNAMDVIAHTVAKATGKRLRPRLRDYRVRQVKLRGALGLPARSF